MTTQSIDSNDVFSGTLPQRARTLSAQVDYRQLRRSLDEYLDLEKKRLSLQIELFQGLLAMAEKIELGQILESPE